jgi:hypothetical protein
MLEVRDLEHQLRRRFPVAGRRLHADGCSSSGSRSCRDEAGQDPLPVFHDDRQLDVELRLPLVGPFDADLILLRAREVTTKFSQSRLGLCPASA